MLGALVWILFPIGCLWSGGDLDAGGTVDAGVLDASAPLEPAPGELGGVCAGGDSCVAGTCTTLPDDRGGRCTQACLENAECPDHLRCEAVSDDQMFCLAGPRGSGGIGDPCGEGQGLGCASGLCISADPQQAIPVDTCTASCLSDPGCAAPFPACNTFLALCLPIGSGETGGLCRFDGSCFDNNVCVDLSGIGERCTRTCATASDCTASYLDCREIAGTDYCVMP